MPSVQIGKYKRPGIYIEEFNDSVIETPNSTGFQSLVIGSSRKGPVNTPIVINSQNELDKIYGQLDRTLEANGSYFHRTISKLLENTPVVAMNILNIDDDLDQIEYKSLSTSTGHKNDVKRKSSYSRFFDTSAFWKKDRESFLGMTKDNEGDENRILHFTNLNDRQITVFIVKSQDTTGYNRTLLDWYGSGENVPLYLDERDYASDYLVDVVVLSGDWTNYNQLSVDPNWGKYFSNTGLIKSQLFNLANDQSINVLGVWRNLSLIPYFRDGNGANIFIEDRINRRTDETGLFCAFDLDATEKNFRTGVFDLIGNSLIGIGAPEQIDFLSYKEDIMETISYPEVKLDTPGNVFQLTFNDYYQNTAKSPRTALHAEGFIHDVQGTYGATFSGITGPTGPGIATYSVSYTTTSDPYAIIGGVKLDISAKIFNYLPSDFSNTNTGTQSVALYIDTDGIIKDTMNLGTLTGNEIVLGKMDVKINTVGSTQYFESIDYIEVSLDANGFIYFDINDDISVTVIGNKITYVFKDTAGSNSDSNNPIVHRRLKTFNNFLSVLNSSNKDRAVILIDDPNSNDGASKMSILDFDSITTVSSASMDREITITAYDANFFNNNPILQASGLILYVTDNEMIMGTDGLITSELFPTTTHGVVGKYSSLYQDYVNGYVNTGDYFYENKIVGSTLNYIKFMEEGGINYIVSDSALSFSFNEVIQVPESSLNGGDLTISNTTPITSGLTGATGSYNAYTLVENVKEEFITNPIKLYSVTNTKYVKFYIMDGELTIDFFNGDLEIPQLEQTNNEMLDIRSQNSNFRQTIEAEEPVGYESVPNKILISASRYPEVRVGNFLEAVISNQLEIGEVPRKMTRIIKKVQYSGDASLIEITCDSEIKLYDFDGDKQTLRFTQVDDYVTTYKGINMFGFRVRNATLPDNTDARLDDIMNIVQKGTPLYNAITDKDIIDFRYLVDSYGLGLASNSKQQLADICGKRLDCFGILNMPSIKQFRNSTSPSFVDKENRLSVEYISLGGNPEESAAFNYSLAEGDGSTSVGYFTPYVIVNDNGRPREIPPAAYVATTFLRKHNTTLTSVVPWTIAAGITNGQVTSIAGLEYSFTGTDIEYLNGMSVNPIVSKRNRGRVIETENTAETLANSALGLIHVREVLIELERDLSDMLLNFQWRYNTPEVRAEIKLRADVICEDYVNRNGLYNFFNKIDSENNTQEIIDNQIGVLDTWIEPIKGMGIIVNNITILKTGGIDSQGFK